MLRLRLWFIRRRPCRAGLRLKCRCSLPRLRFVKLQAYGIIVQTTRETPQAAHKVRLLTSWSVCLDIWSRRSAAMDALPELPFGGFLIKTPVGHCVDRICL